MNNLLAENLMIGDWLYATMQVDDTDEGPVFKTIARRVTDLSKSPNGIYLQDNEQAFADLTPVPLSKEILMDNGFIEDFEHSWCYWRPDCRKFCFVKELDTWYFAFRVNDGGHICIAECNYVHQLQHALNFIGVETDVTLCESRI
jgi:hypothetical protein